MKNKLFLIVFIALVQNFKIKSTMINGKINREIIISSVQKKACLIQYSSEKMKYIDGGITFIYPSEVFTEAPIVIVITEMNGEYSSSITFSPCIVANNFNETTIRVNKITNSLVTEATTKDNIIVHLFALGV